MKILFLSAIVLCLVAQHNSLKPLLGLYYDTKNALANDDAAAVSRSAAALEKAIDNIDPATLPAGERDAFGPLKDRLSYDSRHMAEVPNINHQRAHFASLSLNMYQLAKSVKLSDRPVYEDYCPMKKAYWLTNDPAIKNPYYGRQMPGCGRIAETLK
jgi:hypothetical protein